MIYFSIVFLCMAGMFLFLLEDRFRVYTTVGATAVVYLAALLLSSPLRGSGSGQLPCAVGAALFFLSSLALYRNNFLQKLFLALLCLCNFTFLSFFLPYLLGAMPFSVAGAFAGVFSVLCCLLFFLLMGLCLYRPITHFRDRGPSGFLVGMCLLALLIHLLCLGKIDFLFPAQPNRGRLLLSALLYCVMIFCFRSIYQAGRYRTRAAEAAMRERMLSMRTADFADMMAAVREVRAAEKAGEYALDTVSVMLSDGWTDKIPDYVAIAKENSSKNPVLAQYHEDPYLNAVIAAKAAFAAQTNIEFSCNAVTEGVPLSTAELCVVVNEILTRACREAAVYNGDRRLRFTVFPTEGALRLEAVYTAVPPRQEVFTLKGKTAADVARWLIDDAPKKQDELWGLDNTLEIIDRFSGKLTVSSTDRDEVILHASMRF